MSSPVVNLYLSPGAEETWAQVLRPWLLGGQGRLVRRFVIVPTRGQAMAWKQCCVRAGVALLGVEFITPGLARRKWRPLLKEALPVFGKEYLLLGLRGIIADHLEACAPEDPERGYWQSLRSDPERALDAFDDLLKAGFGPEAFPRAVPARAFGELREWVHELGGRLAHEEALRAALVPPDPGAPVLDVELLVLGLSVEEWGEFFNVAALVRRTRGVTVIVPMPGLRGAGLDEEWVKVWETFLGVPSESLEALPEPTVGGLLAECWRGAEVGAAPPVVEILIGENREAELQLVVRQVSAWLRSGAGMVGVVVPGPGPGHRRLVELMREQAIPFNDLVGRVAAPPPEVQLQRAIVKFWAAGARLDELMELWPLVRSLNCARLEAPHGKFRAVIEAAFEEACDHAVAAAVTNLRIQVKEKNDAAARDVLKLADRLLPEWPPKLTLAEALERFKSVCDAWHLPLPETMGPLGLFSRQVVRAWPRAILADFLLGFLPESAPAEEPVNTHGGFANVTLTTRRRAEGAPWTHLVLLHANAGEWPRRAEPNPWLNDAERAALGPSGRFSLGLFTSEQAAALEKNGMISLLSDAHGAVAMSAALHEDTDPDTRLSPNGLLERVLWARGERRLSEAMVTLARTSAPSSTAAGDAGELAAWQEVYHRRRDPARAFDEHFLCLGPAVGGTESMLPEQVSARTVESSVGDPAIWWFKGLLGLEPQGHDPLLRALARRRGTLAHRLLASAVRPSGCREGEWGRLPAFSEAAARLDELLAAEAAARPPTLYWNSEHSILAAICRDLLAEFYAAGEGELVAVEWWLPPAARLDLDGLSLPLRGRLDVVRSDLPGWAGARLHLYDYKTGRGDKALAASRMAEKGESLQLGVYLAGVRSLGVASAQVWKLQPGASSSLGEDELAESLGGLKRLARALRTGKFGALTRDITGRGAAPWVWPLASVPLPSADLRAKYAATFSEDGDLLKDGDAELETEENDV